MVKPVGAAIWLKWNNGKRVMALEAREDWGDFEAREARGGAGEWEERVRRGGKAA